MTGLFSVIFFIIFSFTLTIMAAPYIVGDLGGSNDIAIYTVAFFGLGNAIGVPFGKFLIGRFRLSSLFLSCMGLFAFFSLCCALAPNYPVFILFRLLQGVVSGPLYPIVSTLVIFFASNERKPFYNSVLVTIFTVVPVVGACWGGWIAYDAQWQIFFYLNTPIIFLLGLSLWLKMRKENMPQERVNIDWMGAVLYLLGVVPLAIGIIMGQELDWFRSSLVAALIPLGSLSLLLFILRSLYHPYPLLELRLFQKFPFAFALFNLAFLFSSYFGMVILLAQWLTLDVRYTPLWIGLLLGTMAVAGIFPPFLLLARVRKLDPRIPLGLAILFFGISCFHTMEFNVDINFGRIAFSRIIAGFALALFLPPIFRMCFQSYSEERTIDVLGVFQVVRSLASGLGASIYSTVWIRRKVFYHDRLGGDLTPSSPQVQQYYERAEQVPLAPEAATEELNFLLDRQATSLGLNDTFWLMTWIMAILFVILLLSLRKKDPGFAHEN